MKIGILCGGFGSEREISLKSAKSIYYSLLKRKHEVLCLDPVLYSKDIKNEELLSYNPVEKTESISSLSKYWDCFDSFKDFGAEIVFNALHGGEGEDGRVSAALNLAGLPYTGSGHLASAIGMDKDLSKRLFLNAGGNTAPWILLTKAEMPDMSRLEELGLPLVVKGNQQGSSVGLTIVKEHGQLKSAIELAFSVDNRVIIEKYIAGREVTVSVLDGEALPVVEIVPKSGIYDYKSKYTKGASEYFAPAKIPEEWSDRLRDEALRAWNALRLENYARIDFRLTDEGETKFLEVNTLPGMTELSLFPLAAAAVGMDFGDLMERIIQSALKRFNS